jgi:tetratricopeptide (TPR) repeat protein
MKMITKNRNRNCSYKEINDKPRKKIFNLRVEKLIREAGDNFLYFRDYLSAMEQVNEILKIDECYVRALILKGDLLFCIDKEKEALEYFEKAIYFDPYCSQAYGSKASTLDVLGRHEEALSCCQKAFENITLKDRELLPSLYEQKITILLELKRYEEAKEALRKSSKLISKEDYNYLISCYRNLIDSSCKERKRKLKLAKEMAMQVVS